MNKTSKILLTSVLTILLCVSLIAGATFALFSGTTPTTIVVGSAKVKVTAGFTNKVEYSRDDQGEPTDEWLSGSADLDENGGVLTLNNMAPYDGVKFDITVYNHSTIGVKWQLQFSVDDDNELFRALDIKLTDEQGEVFNWVDTDEGRLSVWAYLAAAQGDNVPEGKIHADISLPEKAGNEVQGKECTITLTVFAIQGNAETVDPEETDPYTIDGEGNWSIYNAEGLVEFQKYYDANYASGTGKGFEDKTVTLMKDINLANIEWQPIGLATGETTAFRGTFDGNRHTIRNLSINKPTDQYVGLFARVVYDKCTVKDLTISNATVVGGSYVGVVAGRAGSEGNPHFENVKIEGKVEVTGKQFVGAFVGHMGANVDNVTVDVTSDSFVKGGSEVGGIAGVTRSGAQQSGVYNKLTSNISVIWEDMGGAKGPVGGLVGREAGDNVYTDCHVTCDIKGSSEEDLPVNACFGDVSGDNTTVDKFTYEGTIEGSKFDGFYTFFDSSKYPGTQAATIISFKNSTAVVTYDDETITFTANAEGVISDDRG